VFCGFLVILLLFCSPPFGPRRVSTFCLDQNDDDPICIER